MVRPRQGSFKPKFIADAMCGRVCRWLRMLGYDCIYPGDLSDEKLLEVAVKEGDRILITCDKELYRKALSRGLKAFLASHSPVEENLAKLSVAYGVKLEINPDDSRCPICNSKLRKAEKEEVKNLVPHGVLDRYSEFWVCVNCGNVYWKGSHYETMERILENAKRIRNSLL